MLDIERRAIEEKRDYVEFMLHSSELMPGGSPRFPRASDIESLYEDLNAVFEAAHEQFVGMTLGAYAKSM
jgi:hypothetical protein